ncbi:MAG TPA: MarR family transcriptional regulator [Oligoflexus sp.]|uniref:MarR family winged helix-turn-helix transcriptional regulator n=1 Tax=Oligoflexus sp. TaxID=1971216 RepID=UPI002D7E39E1|nr:MarR family transcriptional regulator [Oligoflexus sp.]HET9237720.1 MarR family transcriptional regulator [Oligoflexus sp.]
MNYQDLLMKIAGDWKAKRPDMDFEDSLLILAILRCAVELQTRTEEVFVRFDLNTATFGVLVTLYRSASPEGMTPGEISRHVLVSPASVTNRLDRLVERRLISRHPSVEDRRVQYIRLTDEGTALVETVLPLHLENERKLLEGLNPAQKGKLKGLILDVLGDFPVSESR